jgi:hypothetical protein
LEPFADAGISKLLAEALRENVQILEVFEDCGLTSHEAPCRRA